MGLELHVEMFDWNGVTDKMEASAWGAAAHYSPKWEPSASLIRVGCGNQQGWLLPDDAELLGKMLIRCAAEARKHEQRQPPAETA